MTGMCRYSVWLFFTSLPAGEICFCAFTMKHNNTLGSALAGVRSKHDVFVITGVPDTEE